MVGKGEISSYTYKTIVRISPFSTILPKIKIILENNDKK